MSKLRPIFFVILIALGLATATLSFAPMAIAAPSFDFTDLVEKTSPAVVNIRTTEKATLSQSIGQDDEMQELLRRFFGVPIPQQIPRAPNKRKQLPNQQGAQEELPRGVGSGFIVSPDGYVLTNAHVVDGADEVYVKMTDKREFRAKVIGIDKRTDVAVVKIDGTKLPWLPIGDSDKIKVGQWVVAIGSPFNLDNSVSAGIISAKSRDTGDFVNLIQTDVAVNPGNSGGPLLNMNGEVVGINSQIYSRSGGFMGISFAVPIDEVMRVVEQLKEFGKVSRSRIGIRLSEVPKEVAQSFGLTKGQGAFVNMVEPGLPADKAGIVAGDIVLAFNNQPVNKWTDLARIVANTKPGTRSTVTLWNKAKTRTVNLVTVELEQEKPLKPKVKEDEVKSNMLGLSVIDLPEAQKRELKVTGVLIEAVSGSAERAGLAPGDLISQLNTSEITDAKQFNQLVAKLDPKKPAVLLVRRGDSSQFVALRPM